MRTTGNDADCHVGLAGPPPVVQGPRPGTRDPAEPAAGLHAAPTSGAGLR